MSGETSSLSLSLSLSCSLPSPPLTTSSPCRSPHSPRPSRDLIPPACRLSCLDQQGPTLIPTTVLPTPTTRFQSAPTRRIHKGRPSPIFLPALPQRPEYQSLGVESSYLRTMSTNRPFLANFLAAFRAQSTYKASAAGSQSAAAGPSTLSSTTQLSQGARAIATKASGTASGSASADASSSSTTAATTHHYHHHHHHHQHARPHSHPRSPLAQPSSGVPDSSSSATSTPAAPSSPPTPASSTPIPIANGPDRRRRGSDSSNGSGGFRDALGPEKWYIGGRTSNGEERFYRLGMVTKGGGRLGGSGRVGSIDQLSL